MYQKALAIEPSDVRTLVAWADVLLRKKCIGEAIEKCQEAHEIGSGHPSVWEIWAACLSAMGRQSAADEMLRHARKMRDDTIHRE
jgi:Flp pilus assembly protein TadD